MLEEGLGLGGLSPADMEMVSKPISPSLWVLQNSIVFTTHKLTASISAPKLNLAAPSNLPLVELSSLSGPSIMDPAVNISLPGRNSMAESTRPQRRAAVRAAERIIQVDEDFPTDDAPKKKKTPAAFQLSNKVIPDDAGNIKEALWFHIQLFGRLLHKGAIIGPTPLDLLNGFNRFFNCLDDVTALHDDTTTSTTALGSEHHRINMQSFMLAFMQSTLACYGMRQWNPDLTQPSDSLFNVACRFIVVDTFRQALVTRTYAAYKIPLKYADSYDLLSKIYGHIVHFHYAARFRKELDNPGSVLTATELQARLTRRARLSKVWVNWLTVNKYPSRYIALCQPAATSDDELDPDDSTKKTYHILRRPECSTKAEGWIRRLDMKRIEDNKYRRGGSRQYRRNLPAIPIDSPIETLPQNMPLDYFDPTFFNGLQYHTQQLCADPDMIAIPNNEKTWFTHSTEERLCDEDFTELYGADIFAKYEFVQTDEANMPMEVTDF